MKHPEWPRQNISLNKDLLNNAYILRFDIQGANSVYRTQISKWIRSRLIYTHDIVTQKQSGNVGIYIKLNRNSHILSVCHTNSSDSKTLDMVTTNIFRNEQIPKTPPRLTRTFLH